MKAKPMSSFPIQDRRRAPSQRITSHDALSIHQSMSACRSVLCQVSSTYILWPCGNAAVNLADAGWWRPF